MLTPKIVTQQDDRLYFISNEEAIAAVQNGRKCFLIQVDPILKELTPENVTTID
jgi:hypothetical protein